MILVDTSIWVDHLSLTDPNLAAQLDAGDVLMHPFVLGEIALGHLPRRQQILTQLGKLPKCAVARDPEALTFIHDHKLVAKGVGYVDVHLLLATRLTPESRFWTRDKRLLSVAKSLGIAFEPRLN